MYKQKKLISILFLIFSLGSNSIASDLGGGVLPQMLLMENPTYDFLLKHLPARDLIIKRGNVLHDLDFIEEGSNSITYKSTLNGKNIRIEKSQYHENLFNGSIELNDQQIVIDLVK